MFTTAIRVRPFNVREVAIDTKMGGNTLHSTIKMKNNELLINTDEEECKNTLEIIEHVKLDDDGFLTPKVRESYTNFDHLFWSIPMHLGFSALKYADQKHVFETVGLPVVNLLFEGKNSCIQCYGQTGSGKSLSAWGYHPAFRYAEKSSGDTPDATGTEYEGLSGRIFDEIFARIHEKDTNNNNKTSAGDRNGDDDDDDDSSSNTNKSRMKVEISFIEVYNEKVRDLIPSKTKTDFEREFHPPVFHENQLTKQLGLQNIKRIEVTSASMAKKSIIKSILARCCTSVKMSPIDSRSTAILEITLTTTTTTTCEQENSSSSKLKKKNKKRISSLKIVDWMGSEKVRGGNPSSMNMPPSKINVPIATLRRCINTLLDSQRILRKRLIPRLLGKEGNSDPREEFEDEDEEQTEIINKCLATIPPEQKIPICERRDSDVVSIINLLRESCVTTFLADVFTGKSKCFFVGVISPHESNIEDTLNTLRYIARLKEIEQIVNKVTEYDELDGKVAKSYVTVVDSRKKSQNWLKENEEFYCSDFDEAEKEWNKLLFPPSTKVLVSREVVVE